MSRIPYQSKDGKQLWKAYVCIRSRSIPGVRLQRWKFGCKSEAEARRAENRLYRETQREVSIAEQYGATWCEVLDSWELYLREANHVTDDTKHEYIATLRNHTSGWFNRRAAQLSKGDARELFNQLKVEGRSPALQAKIKAFIGRGFNFGVERNLIKGVETAPTVGLSIEKVPAKKPEILTGGEIRKLLMEARQRNHPWFPIWAFALLTGMRNGELHALLWTDVDRENQLIAVNKSYNYKRKIVKSTKSGEWRDVPISSELGALLDELKAQAVKRIHVLPRFKAWDKGDQARILRKFCAETGLPSIKFHALRACFATQLLRSGVAPIHAQKICGWRDLETMQRYIRLAGIEVQGVTEVLKLLPEPDSSADVVNLFTREPIKPA